MFSQRLLPLAIVPFAVVIASLGYRITAVQLSVGLFVTGAMIAGGIIGNLYDRLGLGYLSTYPIEIKNHVRDWILFRIEGVRFFDPWPNFNIADSMLVCGAIMLFLHAFLVQPPEPQPEDGPERVETVD